MSWLNATVHAYDVMGDVHITVSVSASGDSTEQPIAPVLVRTTTVPGVGETDPALWLEDVLVALLETL